MATTTKTDWNKKELGALWKRESKTTKEKYLVGTLNLKSLGFEQEVPVIIFSNKSKKQDSHPDLRVYLSEKTGKPAAAAKPVAAPTPAPEPDLI